MEETFVEVADEEPRPGEISRESFSEIAGIYVFNALYLWSRFENKRLLRIHYLIMMFSNDTILLRYLSFKFTIL